MEQDKVSKLSDVGQNVWAEDGEGRKNVEQTEKKVSFRQRWDKAKATKKVVFWAVIGAIVLTMIVGFNWGGWVTGEEKPDNKVADACAKLLVQLNQ